MKVSKNNKLILLAIVLIVGSCSILSLFQSQALSNPKKDSVNVTTEKVLVDEPSLEMPLEEEYVGLADLQETVFEELTPYENSREMDMMITYRLDFNFINNIRSLDKAIDAYEAESKQLRNKYTRELQYAFESLCKDWEGTQNWAKAMLYLGLCHEANGHYSRRLEGYENILGIYEAALQADPSPERNIRIQLQYKIAMYQFISEWFPVKGDHKPGDRIKDAAKIFTVLSKENLSGVKTSSGRTMQDMVDMFLTACSSPKSYAGTNAKLEVIADLFKWPNGKGMKRRIEQSLNKGIYD